MTATDPLFLAVIAVVALAYSAVGHGGASGYLAVMAFAGFAQKEASALALCMNLFVSAIAFVAFQRAKHFDGNLAWPFLVGSIPFAFLGGSLKLAGHIHAYILAGALLVASFWLIKGSPKASGASTPPKWPVAVAVGAGIGLISGIVGVGGGIFLSPLMILAGWADAKRTASISALFIFLNSGAGLAARGSGSWSVVESHWPMVGVGILGALFGAWLGANRIPNRALQIGLGIVLLLAVVKLITV